MIQLTPEQKAELERQRQATRLTIKLTAEQRAEYERIVEVEERGREANIAKFHKLQSAKQEPGFSGALRRAISADSRLPHELAAAVKIDVRLLEDFRTGDATLPSDAIDRLVDALHLRLVAELV